ncbi:DUF6036 family nucleotidyltransferase [Arthrobacter methylotrophus]|uniref:DUF6036 family nucleotidyltransferase n=1 Tax=Arthrobacter methylotrophus TaxID=121291 RepID=A0ABV5UUB1_9MICC
MNLPGDAAATGRAVATVPLGNLPAGVSVILVAHQALRLLALNAFSTCQGLGALTIVLHSGNMRPCKPSRKLPPLRREDLEHAIRAATDIIHGDRVIVIGSQSILGSFTEDELPAAITMSDAVDIAPFADDDVGTLADSIDSALGEWSPFHKEFGFYVQAVERETAVLPADWEYRLVGVRNVRTRNSTGLCLDPYDLCAAKLIAARLKDHAFVLALIESSLIDRVQLVDRIRLIDPSEPRRDAALSWVMSLRN